MVARIRTGKSIVGALNYNENKVRTGGAECIAANMFKFGLAVDELTYNMKIDRFQEVIRSNKRSKTNVVHISLNFSVKERIGTDALVKIADSYMEKIGFGQQPYLVYQHLDSAHPHLHILSTSIRDNGKRISLHNLGRIHSEKARKEIEEDFNLVKAEGQQYTPDLLSDLRQLRKASYGKDETRKAITQVVSNVTRLYKYTSIHELNAVLAQYNVLADRGKEGTIMFKKGGLVYSLLDDKGNRIGVPIKASRIYGKPTLKNLEKLFKLNEALRGPLKKRLQDKIDYTFSLDPNPKLRDFVSTLKDEDIATILRKSADGRIYGITFVDHENRVVFNGSDLGKQYGAKPLLDRIKDGHRTTAVDQPISEPPRAVSQRDSTVGRPNEIEIPVAIKDLMRADERWHNVDPALVKRRRRKRKGKSI
jgi:hypothetical protein